MADRRFGDDNVSAGQSFRACPASGGWLAPAATPRSVVARLNEALNAALEDPPVRARLETMGIQARPGTPQAFGEDMRRDLARYQTVVKSAGIRME
jgi:tripartite-type tricarboxylate transporter receptor subunit TctC